MVRHLLDRYGIRCRKSLGQNFLIDGNIVRKIVGASRLSPGDTVVEIGPGLGVLTQALSQTAGLVVAIELDRVLLPVLEETLSRPSNVRIVWDNALNVNFDRLVKGFLKKKEIKPYKVVANLPYYITTPVIMHILEGRFSVKELIIMMQKEVATRILAAPGSKDYGALSVVCRYYSEAELLFTVPRTVFFPRPEVDSAVVRMTIKQEDKHNTRQKQIFLALVRGAFEQRRKTLLNSLSGAIDNIEKRVWINIIRKAGIDPYCRGETLSVSDFMSLAEAFGEETGCCRIKISLPQKVAPPGDEKR